MKDECTGKHTKFQPTEEQWSCPQCGGGPDVFFIDYYADDSYPECGLLHSDDYVICTTCAKSWSGREVSKKLRKKASLVPCPHCNGTGFAKEEEGAGEQQKEGRS